MQGGVQDFAHVIAARLGAEGSVGTLTATDTAILESPSRSDILLQYSGYGYARRGAPMWLLRRILAGRPGFRSLGVFFHELYAVGLPWSSAFWLSPMQRYIAQRLAESADFWLANCEVSGRWLRRFAADKPHAVLPVFSNVGEPAECHSRRHPKGVVFGGSAVRAATYRRAGESLLVWSREQGIEIHDVGPAMQDPAMIDLLRRAGVIVHGRLEPAGVGPLLADASYGIVAYETPAVAKSSVFAAYCAYGVCPILLATRYAPSDGLQAGRHYLPGIPYRSDELHAHLEVGQRAWHWYQDHRIERHVLALKGLLAATGR